jgi:proteasome activator subunit 4
MKSLRNIKLRTYCKTPADLVLARSENPLHNEIFIDQTPQALKDNLQAYGVPLRSSHRKV